jgi:hypothetical protein
METTTLTTVPPDLVPVWERGLGFAEFIAGASPDHKALWEAIQRSHRPSEATLTFTLPVGARILVIAADWCGDAVNTIPALGNWAAAKGIALRIVDRDTWPEVMDHYLTNGSRSIPIVIVLDADFHEIGHWGPRPAELQRWSIEHLPTMPKGERYRETRRWYARDRGETTIREVVAAAQK